MPRLPVALLLLAILVPSARADLPGFAFEGVLPTIFQVYEPLPATDYTKDGAVLTHEQIAGCMDVDPGDPVVLIRDGKVIGSGTIGEIVALRNDAAHDGRLLYVRPAGLPEGVEVPDAPVGPSVLADAGYDLYVLTDKPVEVLAPDPAYADIPWGVQDYCVLVGRQRFAVIREPWRATGGFRGWQVIKFDDTGDFKVHADYTWQPR